mgnify:CR=1 FL=1
MSKGWRLKIFNWLFSYGIKITALLIQLAKYRPVVIIECHRCGLRHAKYPIRWHYLKSWKSILGLWVCLAILDGWMCDGNWSYCPKCAKIILGFVHKVKKEEAL